MADAGTIAIDLIARTEAFIKGAGTSRRTIASLERATVATMRTVKMIGAVAAATAVYGLSRLTKQSMKNIDAVAKMSDRLGVSTEFLIAFNHQAELDGLSVEQFNNRVKRIIEGCGFVRWHDIDLERVHGFLDGLKISEKTFNYYARDFGQFVRWMTDSGRANTAPKGEIPRFKVEKKRVRRPLTADELRGLVKYLSGTQTTHKISTYDRAVLYILAAETGLRAGELGRLQVHNFDLAKGVVFLEKEKTKNREYAELPLKKDRVKQFRAYLSGRNPDDYVFDLRQGARGCELIQKDIKAAGLEVADDTGLEVKFHSLRDTFITSLNQTDAKAHEIKRLARHSMSNDLTFGTYTLITSARLQEIVEQIPAYGWPGEAAELKEKTA